MVGVDKPWHYHMIFQAKNLISMLVLLWKICCQTHPGNAVVSYVDGCIPQLSAVLIKRMKYAYILYI